MMKRILTIVWLCIAIGATAQTPWNKQAVYTKPNGSMPDSVSYAPRTKAPRSGTYLGAPVGDSGRIAYEGKSLWVHNDTGWARISYAGEVPLGVLDSARRSNDTLYFRTSSGSEIAVKMEGIRIPGVVGLQDSLDIKLGVPLATNNSLNALIVVDGQNKPYIRSTDSLPYVKNQFAGEQPGAELWIEGRVRAKGPIQRIDNGMAQPSLIEWLKSDASTMRGRIGYFNSGVFGTTDTWGALNFLGPAFLAGKKDSTVALGTIDGVTISAKLAIRGQNMFLRRSGMIVDLNGALLDSLTGVAVTSPYFFNVSAGADNTSASFSAGVRMRRLNADTLVSLNGAPIVVNQKLRHIGATGSYWFDLRRDFNATGLLFDAGGGVARYNSYDSTNTAYGRHYFESTKGSTTKVVAVMDANTDRTGIGPATSLHTFFQVQGAMSLPTTTVTGNTTLNETHFTLRVNNTGSATITLPTASGVTGRVYCIKKISAAANDVVITGVKTLTLQGSSVIVQSNGTSWDILASHAESTTL